MSEEKTCRLSDEDIKKILEQLSYSSSMDSELGKLLLLAVRKEGVSRWAVEDLISRLTNRDKDIIQRTIKYLDDLEKKAAEEEEKF